MQDARLELKLSQKDVAQKVNEKPSVIQDYESSKAIPNPQILGKLERALGVKLRGLYIIFLWYLFPKSHCPLDRLWHWEKTGWTKENVTFIPLDPVVDCHPVIDVLEM